MDVSNTIRTAFSSVLSEAGITRPTDIQVKAWPVIVRRRHCLIIAPTGAGKTEAAILPVLASIAAKRGQGEGIRAVYVTPLRALNRDILQRLRRYARVVGLDAEVRHGDSPRSVRRKTLLKPPELLVTTPETLSILLSSKRFKTHFRDVEWVVVDEIHELVNNKRGAHLAISLQRLCSVAVQRPTMIGISATVGNPAQAGRYLAGEGQKCAILIDSSSRSYEVKVVFLRGDLKGFVNYVIQDIGDHGYRTCLVFANTRDEVEILTMLFRDSELSVGAHHGSLAREVREEVEMALRRNEVQVVVCTSSLELGIDLGGIDHVYQLNSPRQVSKLVQRIGRSLHGVGMKASGTVICVDIEEYVESLALVERLKKGDVEKVMPLNGPLDVLAHHVVGMVLERGPLDAVEALNVFKRAYQYRLLERPVLEEVINELAGNLLLRRSENVVRGHGQRTLTYYYSGVSMIPDVETYEVVELTSRKRIGYIDERFVMENLGRGQSFILRGEPWRVLSIDDNEARVLVERANTLAGAIPIWAGESIPVEKETALIVGRIRAVKGLVHDRTLDEFRSRMLQELGTIPDSKNIVIEINRRGVVIHSCFGTKINNTFECIFSALTRSIYGIPFQTISDPYRIFVGGGTPELGNKLKEFLSTISEIRGLVCEEIVSRKMFHYTLWQVAKRFGVIDRNAKYDERAARAVLDRYKDTPIFREALGELLQRKYDIEGTEEVLRSILFGQIGVHTRQLETCSQVASRMVEEAAFLGVGGLHQAVEDLKERLARRHVKTLCLTCGKWMRIFKVYDTPDAIKCPLCHSKMVALVSPFNNEIEKTTRKKVEHRPLTKEEEVAFRKAWKSASLFLSFGKKAAIALACYGVGEQTAARILQRSLTEFDLYLNLYFAERNYLLYRQYWRA